MTSFVNVLADDDWSEADIVARMEALIREQCSQAEEMILHRKMLGASIGQYALSADEQAEIAAYAGVCKQAQDAGRAARADMALLRQAWGVERGEIDPATVDQAVTDLVAARAAARPTPAPTPEPLP